MRFSQYLTASAVAALASAQTFTKCDPTKKDCPNDPAMAATFETNFKAGADQVKGWKQTAGKLNYGKDGAEFTIAAKGDSPTIQSEGYLHFGYIEVKAKAASGQGIISSIVLESEDLDEVDWEFIGTTTTNVQMNYYGKGNTTTYDRMIPGDVSTPQQTMHTYALNWTADSLTWIIDNNPVRTLKYGDANGGNNYPQTPSTVRIGIWAGGDSGNQPGVIEWAGGKTDYSKAPFTMTVESVKVINYSPGKEYQWTDKSGSYKSIKVIGAGDKQGAPQNSQTIQPSATATGGGDIKSNIDVPSSTPCTEEQQQSSTPAPTSTTCTEESHQTSTPGASSTPCDCGVATVTVTGPPPPPASQTGEAPPPPPASSAPATSAVPPPPPPPPASSAPATSAAPPPPPPASSAPATSAPPPPPESSVAPPPPPSSSPEASTTPCTTTPTPAPETSVVPPPPSSETPPPASSSSPPPPPPESSAPATSAAPPPPPPSSETPPPASSTPPPPPPPESSAPATSAPPPPPASSAPATSAPPPPPESSVAPPPPPSSSPEASTTPCSETPAPTPSGGAPPPPPPESQTSVVPPPPSSSPEGSSTPCTTTNTVRVTIPASSPPPYPTTTPCTTGGLIVDSSPAPVVPYPTNPSGAYSGYNGTVTASATPSQFTGGAVAGKKVGGLLAVAMGVAAYAL